MPRSKRPYHHGNLRRELLDWAGRMLDEVGANQLSMRDLARSAGVSQAAPFRHFASKDALLAALAEEGFEELETKMLASEAGADHSRLYCLAEAYLDLAARRPHFFRMMFSADLGPSRVAEGIYRACDRVYGMLRQALLDSQASGQLTKTNPDEQALLFWSTLHGYAMLLIDHRLDDLCLDLKAQQALLQRLLEKVLLGLSERSG